MRLNNKLGAPKNERKIKSMSSRRTVRSPRGTVWDLAAFERFIEPPIPYLNPDYAIPSPLFHYTSGAAFVSILKCRYLRATNFSYLNDPSEVLYGTNLIWRSLRDRGIGQTVSVGRFLEELLRAFETIAASEVYVCSFSGLRDDLSQWRAYGNSTPERIALGFDPGALHDQARTFAAATFERVYYDEAEQVTRINYVLAKAIEAATLSKVKGGQLGSFAMATARRLGRLLPTMKDPAYRNEQEWRVILWENGAVSDVQFDTSRGVMRPFLPFRLRSPIPLLEVLLLAPNRTAPSLKAAKIALIQGGLANLDPQSSKVPFAD